MTRVTLTHPADDQTPSMESISCHFGRVAGNRRQLLQAGIGAAGMLLVAPATRLFHGEAAAQSQSFENTTASAARPGKLGELLSLALQHEHGAMVQYANHAGLLSHWINPAHAKTIQEIIADEVGHAIILVNALIAMDITPTLAVWPPRSGDQARELILMDIAAEQGAVELYSEILEHDLGPELRAAITAIRDAEILHRNNFNDLLEMV